jgi:hypothetical protein
MNENDDQADQNNFPAGNAQGSNGAGEFLGA